MAAAAAALAVSRDGGSGRLKLHMAPPQYIVYCMQSEKHVEAAYSRTAAPGTLACSDTCISDILLHAQRASRQRGGVVKIVQQYV